MRVNSSRNSLARARMIRSASRQGRAKALSNRTNAASNKNNKVSNTTGSGTSASNSQITAYENMEKAAKALQTDVKNLMKYSSDTTEQKTDASAKEKITEQIGEFVGNYNSLAKALSQAGGTTNSMFLKQLKSSFTVNQKELQAIGITMDSAGTLSVDSKVLEAADVADLQKPFCEKDCYASKISSKCESIESCASATIKVLNKMYGTQTTYNRYGTSGYYYGSSGSRYSADS